MSILDDIKSVIGIIQKVDNIDLYQKILDIQRQALNLVDENRKVEEEKSSLEKQLDISDRLVFSTSESAYMLRTNELPDGPFCTRCYDVDKKIVRLHHGLVEDVLECPHCERTVHINKDSYLRFP